MLREIGEPAAQGYAYTELGLVQRLTGHYQAAASHEQAVQLMRNADEPYGLAYALSGLGELARLDGFMILQGSPTDTAGGRDWIICTRQRRQGRLRLCHER